VHMHKMMYVCCRKSNKANMNWNFLRLLHSAILSREHLLLERDKRDDRVGISLDEELQSYLVVLSNVCILCLFGIYDSQKMCVCNKTNNTKLLSFKQTQQKRIINVEVPLPCQTLFIHHLLL
jgi:hypothetical protein